MQPQAECAVGYGISWNLQANSPRGKGPHCVKDESALQNHSLKIRSSTFWLFMGHILKEFVLILVPGFNVCKLVVHFLSATLLAYHFIEYSCLLFN